MTDEPIEPREPMSGGAGSSPDLAAEWRRVGEALGQLGGGIGDSVRTDFTGAASYGIDCLFVTAGIHAAEFGGRDDPDPDAVERMLMAAGGKPRAIARKLKW